MRIGAHLSIAGGMDRAARSAVELGCECLQVFSRSPRGGKARELREPEILEMKRILEGAGIRPLIVHVPYLVNLGSADEGLYRYGYEVVRDDLARAAALGAPYLVMHTGHASGDPPERALARVAGALIALQGEWPGGVELLLENTAGGPKDLGGAMEEQAALIEACGSPSNLGLCLDTCHAFAAGYDLRTDDGIDALFEGISRVGTHRLKVVHLNDSKQPAGSRKDRHEHVGEGLIGEEGFLRFLSRPEAEGLPLILETPVPGRDDYRKDLAALRSLRERVAGCRAP